MDNSLWLLAMEVQAHTVGAGVAHALSNSNQFPMQSQKVFAITCKPGCGTRLSKNCYTE